MGLRRLHGREAVEVNPFYATEFPVEVTEEDWLDMPDDMRDLLPSKCGCGCGNAIGPVWTNTSGPYATNDYCYVEFFVLDVKEMHALHWACKDREDYDAIMADAPPIDTLNTEPF